MIPHSVFALTFYHRLGKNVHGQKCSVELSRICNKINENSINPAKNQYFIRFQRIKDDSKKAGRLLFFVIFQCIFL